MHDGSPVLPTTKSFQCPLVLLPYIHYRFFCGHAEGFGSAVHQGGAWFANRLQTGGPRNIPAIGALAGKSADQPFRISTTWECFYALCSCEAVGQGLSMRHHGLNGFSGFMAPRN